MLPPSGLEGVDDSGSDIDSDMSSWTAVAQKFAQVMPLGIGRNMSSPLPPFSGKPPDEGGVHMGVSMVTLMVVFTALTNPTDMSTHIETRRP